MKFCNIFPKQGFFSIISAVVLLGFLNVFSQTVTYYQTGEEFVGPFTSWKNVKTDYNAKGDGATNDAPAIQSALDAMKTVTTNTWTTLYFPAGTYRINSTITTTRVAHSDHLGVQIIGEDPATTVILWNGPDSGVMFRWDAWYAKISRLTLDGAGKAGTALSRDGGFATYGEISDMVFENVMGTGLDLSAPNGGGGQAENSIMRCKFINCGCGILACNWNSLDEYVWYCLFQDCGYGINMCTGSAQVFNNIFLRSKTIDIQVGPVWVSIVNNVSVGSKAFSIATRGFVGGNRIYNTTNTYSMPIADVMINNTIRSSTGSTSAVTLSNGNHLLVGNTFTTPALPTPNSMYRYFIADQNYVARTDIVVPTTLSLPGVPQNLHRTIYEVAKNTGDDAAEIQRQVFACTLSTAGANPVIHLSKGSYSLKRMVYIPSKKEMQIIGDGGNENGTVIRWSGTGTGPGFRLLGPNRATIRDMSFNFTGSGADVMLIDNCDYPAGGRVYCEQVSGGGYTAGQEADVACFVDGVENSDVTLRNGGFGCFIRCGVLVRGGRCLGAGGNPGYQVDYLAGAMGNTPNNLFDVTNNGRLIALGFRDETSMEGTYINLTSASSGFLSVGTMSWAQTPSLTVPLCKVNGFAGTFTFLSNTVGAGYGDNSGSIFFQITGNGQKTKVLNTCNDYSSQNSITVANTWKDNSSPAAKAALFNCSGGPVNGSRTAIPNVFSQNLNTVPDTQFVRDAVAMFRSLRTDPPLKKADGLTDVKLIRLNTVMSAGRIGFTLRADTTKQVIGVLGRKVLSGPKLSYSLQKISIGRNKFPIPTGIKCIYVYDVQGRMIWKKTITNAQNSLDAANRIAAFGKQGMVLVDFIK